MKVVEFEDRGMISLFVVDDVKQMVPPQIIEMSENSNCPFSPFVYNR